MPRRVKAVSHEDRLTLVEHLDELRHRLIDPACSPARPTGRRGGRGQPSTQE
jgi:hypothetical protein